MVSWADLMGEITTSFVQTEADLPSHPLGSTPAPSLLVAAASEEQRAWKRIHQVEEKGTGAFSRVLVPVQYYF